MWLGDFDIPRVLGVERPACLEGYGSSLGVSYERKRKGIEMTARKGRSDVWESLVICLALQSPLRLLLPLLHIRVLAFYILRDTVNLSKYPSKESVLYVIVCALPLRHISPTHRHVGNLFFSQILFSEWESELTTAIKDNQHRTTSKFRIVIPKHHKVSPGKDIYINNKLHRS